MGFRNGSSQRPGEIIYPNNSCVVRALSEYSVRSCITDTHATVEGALRTDQVQGRVRDFSELVIAMRADTASRN